LHVYADPEAQRLLDEARKLDWAKFERYAAAVLVVGKEKAMRSFDSG